ncbi:alkaline phosphatase D family protein [uncultured Kriegella sp.]|uniref:alkaline phosphatase D family protein n=1 Tax=uncultured Kriegella sp. TaxID=1798910 RepID=UPI0030D7D6BE
MKRRDSLKKMALGAIVPCVSPSILTNSKFQVWPFSKGLSFKSDWQNWPDMKWVGPEYWGNRLQDWLLKEGKVTCDISAANRNLHLLTVQKPEQNIAFTTSVAIEILNKKFANLDEGCLGIRFGAKGPFEDYRSAAVFGKGFDIGLKPNGTLQVGETILETGLNSPPEKFGLLVEANPDGDIYSLKIWITAAGTDQVYFESEAISTPSIDLAGNFALVAHCPQKKKNAEDLSPSATFGDWTITSEELRLNKAQSFGPICFAQYTVNNRKLKLTAQMAPIEAIMGHAVALQIMEGSTWKTLATAQVEHCGRAVNFSVDNFTKDDEVPYRIQIKIPLRNRIESYDYHGTIAKEPMASDQVKTAVFSCNFHFGFPDNDILLNTRKLDPDIVLFLGDQFYEGTGGFGAMYSGDFDKTCLDYLRKWFMFGWSYRDIFRHRPCAIIPDDHDVYHGNVWGEQGKKADTSKGYGAPAQDSGGYKMAADWVNMVQFTQTSHLPDPFDATPVKQGIGVYYTQWNYGGVSFAILEDRKFKSAPKHVLPEEADVWNGFIKNPDFDIKKHKNLKAELLGERQQKFLEHWVEDWNHGAQMKVVLSQTNFATVATLPKEAQTDEVVPSLYIPQKGEYVSGDKPTADMDSNGWPANKRDEAVATIRKCFAFHIAGDQHLGSFIQYGVEEHGDSGYAFAGPALNNIWPRRFWPSVNSAGHTYQNPAYTGDHVDGFGNKMTVKAVANPYKTGFEPEIIHNRATGYGMVTFNKIDRTIKTDCWSRFVDPSQGESVQNAGWPITIRQEDNYARKAVAQLPELQIIDGSSPVVSIYDATTTLVYCLRLSSRSFKPKVFALGKYTIVVEETDREVKRTYKNVKAKEQNKKIIKVDFSV